jgi:hypothetical protein
MDHQIPAEKQSEYASFSLETERLMLRPFREEDAPDV